ncbi:MAG: 16S rRNA (cytidine(1402)-2'-O)-methyltransferase, partial [Actinomycetaceae bacterium]|nr:16S rRNA (cytidine(1402)-2'-O)-methyltransferase [Actinomycetaceae bacterium]
SDSHTDLPCKAQWKWPERTLILAATPIGNLGDASQRLIQALAQATIIAAEDTRKAQQLIKGLGVATHPRLRFVSCFEHNEHRRAPSLVDAIISEGEQVLAISDAGMPTVSDPGYVLTSHAIECGINVSVIPGPSAVVSALAVSGLPSDRFCFEGFVPRKAVALQRFFRQLKDETRTMIFFESAQRIHATLGVAAEVFGNDRPAALCREMTKIYEETLRGTLQELYERTSTGMKGEIVFLLHGAIDKSVHITIEEAVNAAKELASSDDIRLKQACKRIAGTCEYSASDIYDHAQQISS